MSDTVVEPYNGNIIIAATHICIHLIILRSYALHAPADREFGLNCVHRQRCAVR
jgi:hypothetical protein